jgi:5'-nucleotidase
MTRPLILASNDDGVHAPGVHTLREALLPIADVIVVAPEHEQSGTSHSISLHAPLRHKRHGEGVHSIAGTPADCIYVALYLEGLLPRWPDLVVSGINAGANLGDDVFYSGTVAAAREAALRGVPAIAFSLLAGGDLTLAGRYAREMTERLLATPKPEGQPPLLSVNFPPGPHRGTRATRLGRRLYSDGVDVRTDPRGGEYYWIGGPAGAQHPHLDGSDTEAVDAGYVSVTPLGLSATQPEHLAIATFVGGG